mgnify:CR=1 FL=1
MYDLKQTIVLDIGSKNLKIGFSGESKPKSVFPSVAGSPKYCCSMDHTIPCFYGYQAVHYSGVLVLNEINQEFLILQNYKMNFQVKNFIKFGKFRQIKILLNHLEELECA